MSNSKISALASATTPLAGTEVLPIVQSGVTKKVTIANLTVGRAVGSAGGTFTDNFVQGTSGKGTNFTANTPAAGKTSQLLNWYEEGTWTPTVTGSVSNPTLTIDATYTGGRYTRIGRTVYITFEVRWSAVSGGSGDVVITGLPFTRNSTTQPPSDFFAVNSRGVTYSGDTLVCVIGSGSNSITFSSNNPAGDAQYTLAVSGLGVASIGFLRGSGSYMV